MTLFVGKKKFESALQSVEEHHKQLTKNRNIWRYRISEITPTKPSARQCFMQKHTHICYAEGRVLNDNTETRTHGVKSASSTR